MGEKVSSTTSPDTIRALQAAPVRPTPLHLVAVLMQVLVMVVAVVSWRSGWWPVTVLAWCTIAWLDHAALTRLHEAAHGMLARNRWFNEVQGIFIGTLALTPLSVYRYVHARHHAHLGRERDPEFWPYNLPWTPRWIRLTYAWSELVGGWLLTPVLYSIRTAGSWHIVPGRQRGRLVAEWVLLVSFWAGLLVLIEARGWWEVFIIAHLVPAWLAGTMQTIRKFTEHLGMFGDGIFAMTRVIVYRNPLGRAASSSQLHVEHHATHHRYARIPYYVLPGATSIALEKDPGQRVFRNHLEAIIDVVPHLLNPRLGPQWRISRADAT
jgi:fatty acid desaturase